MKFVLLFLIVVYQKIISPILKLLVGQSAMCRFTPSCSEYAKRSIFKHGVLKGGKMSLVRLLSCQPFNNFAFLTFNF